MTGFAEPAAEVLKGTFSKLRFSFQRGETLSVERRRFALQRLKDVVMRRLNDLDDASQKDLGLNSTFSFMAGGMHVITEIDLALRKLDRWTKPVRQDTPIMMFPSKITEVNEPLGVVLVIGAWNYPVSTTMLPVISAIAAGNAVIAKPSEHAPHSARVITEIINSIDTNFYYGFEGGIPTSVTLNKLPFDLIVFTGGTVTGKFIMKDASDNLCKLLLELGGKNPTIIDTDANIELAAKRIVNMKFMNAGQTCVTADMVFVARAVKDRFMAEMIKQTRAMVGTDAKGSRDFARIVNENHSKRLLKYLEGQDDKVVFQAGQSDVSAKFVPPTILLNPGADALLNKEEIFGPILPVFDFGDIREVIERINANDKPLGIYYFGDQCSANFQTLKRETSSGSLVANDIGVQYLCFSTGFGGVGGSGVGKIRGYEGFKYCSNQKVVIERSANPWLDLAFRYAPTSDDSRRKFMFLAKHFGSYTIEDITCVLKKVLLAIVLITALVYLCRRI